MRVGVFSLLFFAAFAIRLAGAQCTPGWQSPQELEVSGGRPAYVESGIALPMPRALLLIGTPAFMWGERNAFDPPPSAGGLDTSAYLIRLRNNMDVVGFLIGPDNVVTPVRHPKVSGPMRKLAAVMGADGTIHVIWLSSAPGATDPDSEGAVWYAELRNGEWTLPTIVFSADRLDWSGQKPSLLVARNSDIHIVIPFYRSVAAGIAHVRRINGLWSATETSLRSLPSEVTAQFLGPDSLAIAFAGIGAPGVRQRNGQHIYLIRKAISDTVWPTPAMVHWSGLAGISQLRLHGTPPGNKSSRLLTLVWMPFQNGPRSPIDSVYAISSDDGGVAWHSPEILPLPFRALFLTQNPDARGGVHIAATPATKSEAENANIYHAVLNHGRWSALDSVLTGPVASAPALSSIGPDTEILVWGHPRSADAAHPTAIAPVTRYTTLIGSCHRP